MVGVINLSLPPELAELTCIKLVRLTLKGANSRLLIGDSLINICWRIILCGALGFSARCEPVQTRGVWLAGCVQRAMTI